MKKILFIATIIICLSMGAKAQTFGRSYTKISFVQPLGEYKDFYNSGFGVEFGRMFPVFIIEPEYNMTVGLDLTFLYASLNFGKEHSYGKFIYGTLGSTIMGKELKTQGGCLLDLGVKIGPSFSMEVVKDLNIDVAFQYAPTLVLSVRKGPDEEYATAINQDKTKSSASFSFAHRFSLKGNLRYQHFIFGLEYLFGSTTLHYGSAIIPNWEYDSSSYVYKPQKEVDMGLGTLVLSVGLTF
ncbi:MAG: hypothetical protein Q4Q06_06740 [Bacteroidota bacterium]|nr:hypothetical protein [Bacteroidota bacterium]